MCWVDAVNLGPTKNDIGSPGSRLGTQRLGGKKAWLDGRLLARAMARGRLGREHAAGAGRLFLSWFLAVGLLPRLLDLAGLTMDASNCMTHHKYAPKIDCMGSK